MPVLPHRQAGQVCQGVEMSRIQGDAFSPTLGRLVQLILEDGQRRQVEVALGIVGLELHGPADRDAGLGQPTLLSQHRAQQVMGFGMRCVGGDDLSEELFRASEIAAALTVFSLVENFSDRGHRHFSLFQPLEFSLLIAERIAIKCRVPRASCPCPGIALATRQWHPRPVAPAA